MSKKVKLTPDHLKVLRKLCLERFKFFVEALWSPEFYDRVFHGKVCDFLQFGDPGKPSQDRLIVLPRSFLKTTIAATLYPLWEGTKDSSKRILIVSNSAENSGKTVHSIKDIIQNNQLYNALFPEVIPNFGRVRWTDSCACLKREVDHPEGTFESVGVGSNVIRRHYNLIIEDDTVAPKKDELSGTEIMPSRSEIEKAVNFHKLTIPLLVNFPTDKRVCIGTRWASYDLIEHIKKEEVGHRFSMLDIPAIDPETKKPNYKRYNEEALKDIKRGLGTFMFAALYMNDPLSEEFMKFRPTWMKYYKEGDLPEEGYCMVTVDPADPPTGKSRQDYCAIVSCKHTHSGLFVRRYRRGRFSEAETIRHAFELAEIDDATVIRVEADRYAHLAAGFKVEAAKRARENLGKARVVEAVKTRGRKKEARILRISPIMENGLLFLKAGMDELESELYSFDRGVTDDLIDSLAWQIDDSFLVNREVEKKVESTKKNVSFTFDQIVDSLADPRSSRYPFDKQLEKVGLSRWN